MSRLHGLSKEQVDDAEMLRVFARQEKNYGAVLENLRVLARVPPIFRGFRAMWDGLEESGLLGTRLVSLVNLRVAGMIGCTLCVRANSAVCRIAGITDEELATLSEREMAALAYADAITISNDVDAELFENVRRHFSEAETIELTATITFEICVAKFNRVLEIE